MKNVASNAYIIFLIKNIICKNIDQYYLNNTDMLLHKIVRFIRSFIKIAINIIADTSDANSTSSNLTSNNSLTHTVIQLDNIFSNDKSRSTYNNSLFIFNNNGS